jgi:UDP-2-acetamido-3-amino-2,3-dideoxy-glucuronate N-acetyltransferase
MPRRRASHTTGFVGVSTASKVHPTSEVHPSARIGADTKVWHFCHVMEGAEIGARCSLGQNVFVARGVKVGDDVKIQNNVSLYEGVELGDGVFCGPSCVFTNVNTPRSRVSRRNEYAKTRVGEGATIGANATIVCGNEIGRFAFVGAGSVVTGPVPEYALVYGSPARVKGWMCECGEKLSFKGTQAKCKRCQSAYRKASGKIKKT